LRNDSRGFTLIEVLVAFAILALTLMVLLRVFGTGLRTVDASERYLMATMLARSVLDDLGAETPVVPGERSGEIGEDYRWRMEVAPSRTIAPVRSGIQSQVPYEVRVEISWNGRPVMSLTTLRVAAQAQSSR
jgi:general secretion pathway protein I